MPEETIITEVVESVEENVEEVSILKLAAIVAGTCALGFAAFIGGRHLKRVIAAKLEAKNETPADDGNDAKPTFKEVTEEDNK